MFANWLIGSLGSLVNWIALDRLESGDGPCTMTLGTYTGSFLTSTAMLLTKKPKSHDFFITSVFCLLTVPFICFLNF